jgi:hypothetical protein
LLKNKRNEMNESEIEKEDNNSEILSSVVSSSSLFDNVDLILFIQSLPKVFSEYALFEMNVCGNVEKSKIIQVYFYTLFLLFWFCCIFYMWVASTREMWSLY